MDHILTSSSTFFLLLTLLFTILVSSLYFTFNHYISSKKQTLGFKNYPFLGTLPEFISNRHRFLDWTTDVLVPLPNHTSIFIRPGKINGIMTAYPPNIEHFLKTRFDNYHKGPRFISLLHDLLGTGIFNSDGHLWRIQRKTASLEFNTRSLKNFVLDSVRFEITTRLIPILKAASGSGPDTDLGPSPGRVLDMQDILERFSFDSVCRLAFDYDPGCLAGDGSGESEFMRAFDVAATLSSGRFLYVVPRLWIIKKWLNVGSEKRLRDSIQTVHKFADKIIRTKLEEITTTNNNNLASNHRDLLSRFISTEEISTRDPNLLRDIVISFILAGRDSTSSGLSWFFWLLSNNPRVLKNIRQEVDEVRIRAGKQVGDTYNFEELREMNYLHGAISEALRLYPPVPVDTRACLEDDILPSGDEIKKGWFITYNSYAMGRMESIWGKDCLEFRPERWIDENRSYKPDNPFKFPIFHAGPRICLGKEMAYLQMKSIVACVVEQFDIGVVEKKRPHYVLSLTLRMKNGLPVKVNAR
ncbi:unnamed protein product [Amaranthus hypochondriacus]